MSILRLSKRDHAVVIDGAELGGVGNHCRNPCGDVFTWVRHFTFSMSPGFQLLLNAASVGP